MSVISVLLAQRARESPNNSGKYVLGATSHSRAGGTVLIKSTDPFELPEVDSRKPASLAPRSSVLDRY